MSLKEYNRKRNFKKTPEPKGKKKKPVKAPRFFVQCHDATRLHFDFRLEMDGVLKSWAIPKGPSLNPLDQRLAVFVEDHPIDYGSFEGTIPRGNYGAGTVMLWDYGTYVDRKTMDPKQSEEQVIEGLSKGRLTFVLDGKRLNGEFALIKLNRGDPKAWLFIKKRDEHALFKTYQPDEFSIQTGRNFEEIASEAPSKGDVWISKRVKADLTAKPSVAPTVKLPRTKLRASKEKLPRRLKPILPTFYRAAFNKNDWIFEPIYGGVRAIAEIEKGQVSIHSKALLSLKSKYPAVSKSLSNLKKSLVLDGEIVASGKTHCYIVYDLLHLEGKNLRELPLSERRKQLLKLKFPEGVSVAEGQKKSGVPFFESCLKNSFQGIVAKHLKTPYESGTSKFWLKIQDENKTSPSQPRFTHLDKIYWPEEKISKGDIVEYYRSISKWILPYLKDRPQSMNRHPDGIHGESFYHKDVQGFLPRFVETTRVESRGQGKSINYLLCQNETTLLYMANLGCIELNPWISKTPDLDYADYVIIDLDPDDSNSFEQVVEVAQKTKEVLRSYKIQSYCKTSGATGLHVVIPTHGRYDFEEGREYARKVCEIVHQDFKKLTSLERSPNKRRGKIYLDYMQNRRGSTMAAPYCVRPRPGATVSAPLDWKEVKRGLDPKDFTIFNILKRLKKKGDLWKGTLTKPQNFDRLELS